MTKARSGESPDSNAKVPEALAQHPRWRIALNTPTAAAAVVSLLVLGWLSTFDSATWIVDHPYEEARDLYALRNPAATRAAVGLWTENPPLDILCRRGVAAITGLSSRSVMRLPSLFYLVVSFLLTAWIVSGSAKLRNCPTVTGLAISFGLHAMPVLLIGVRRVSPTLLACIGVECVVASSWGLLTRPSGRWLGATAASHAILIWSHPYGLLISLALAMGLVLSALLPTSRARDAHGSVIRLILQLLPAMLVLAVPLVHFGWWRSYHRQIAGSYWTEPIFRSSFGKMLAHPVLLGVPPLSDPVPEVLPATLAFLGMAGIIGLARYKDPRSYFSGVAIILTTVTVLVAERMGGAFLMMHAAGPILFALFLCGSVVFSRLGAWGDTLLQVVLTMVVVLPTFARTADRPVRDDDWITAASRTLIRRAEPDLPIMIAGSRLYFLFYEKLAPLAQDRVRVYTRDRFNPDNFVGRSLLPPSMILTDADLEQLREREPRVLYAQMGGSQTINIDNSGWKANDIDSYRISAPSVGTINLIDLTSVRHASQSNPHPTSISP